MVRALIAMGCNPTSFTEGEVQIVCMTLQVLAKGAKGEGGGGGVTHPISIPLMWYYRNAIMIWSYF